MFNMKIESQMNMHDRTLICGIPQFDSVPKEVVIAGNRYDVIGVSSGVNPPYVSLEIMKTDTKMVGEEAIS